MKFRSFLGIVLAIGASGLLGSCGGGGAASTGANAPGTTLFVTPANATFFAGIPATFQIVGGRAPFTITSSQPALFPVPGTTNNTSITVLPQNPSVVSTGSGTVPASQVVNIDVHDALGAASTAAFIIEQNFLTGYGFTFVSTACANPGPTAPSTTTVQPPTAGCDTVVQVTTSVNGNLHANQTFRFDVVTGNFLLVDPNTNVAGTSVTTNTDHDGKALVIIRVPNGALTQVGVFRITDVASGVSTSEAFTITGTNNNSLTTVPTTFTFTGALTTQCGTGSGTFFVFGGTPPFTAASSDPNITVTSSSNSQPGSFTVTAINPNVCSTNATIVVTDSLGQHTTATVTTAAGSQAPPTPAAFSVAPTSLTLACNQSGSVTAVGGSGSYSATASNTDLGVVVSGGTITITRNGGDPVPPFAQPTSQSVTVTDGATTQTVTVTVPANCP